MDNHLNELRSQFGASVEMLKNAIEACPDNFWVTDKQFWYNAFHCTFFMDYYLCPNPAEFLPPVPFDLSEFEDIMPSRTYSKSEIIQYIAYCKQKAEVFFENLAMADAMPRWINESGSMNYSYFEILIYNLRHIQHHAAQLNTLLRQNGDTPPEWIFRA